MKKITNHAYINDVAFRCFRNTGDGDYITARMAFRAGMFIQFFWSAEQAIEKYLKCLLMLNRRKSKFGHDISKGLTLVNETLPFTIQLTPYEQDIFTRIARQDADRYLSLSYAIEGPELLHLDFLIWKIRQYCRALDVKDIYSEPDAILLKENLALLEERMKSGNPSPEDWRLPGGLLEYVLSKRDHPARPHLIWQNPRFVTRRRKTVKVTNQIAAENSPFWLRPELVPEVSQYMQIPDRYIQHYGQYATERASPLDKR